MAHLTNNPADELKPAANVTLNSEAQHKQSSNKSRCMKFFSTSGCPYGEQCHFQHFVLQGSLACTIASLPALGGAKKRALLLNLLDPSLHVRGYKTKLCHNYSTSHGCKYGEHCHYAHTNAELRSRTSSAAYYDGRNLELSSSNPCSGDAFSAFQYPLVISTCTWSSSNKSTCGLPFAPMDNLTSSLYYGEPTPPGVSCEHAFNYKEGLRPCEGTSSRSNTYGTTLSPNSVLMEQCNERGDIINKESVKVASMPIDAAMAGLIIGREGSNVRQLSKLTGSKLSIREHSEGDGKRRIMHMEGLPHQVDGALQMIKLLIQAKGVPSK